MKKIFTILFILIITTTSFSQVETIWENSATAGTMPAWYSTSNTERGLAYNYVNDHLYVVSRNDGLSVKIIDVADGSELGELDVTGINGGTYILNDIGVTFDGKIYASNLAIGESASFKVYRWDNEEAVPEVAFESDLGGINKRVGDKISVTGTAGDNQMALMAVDATAENVLELGTDNAGDTLTINATVNLPGEIGSSPIAVPVLGDEPSFILNSNGHLLSRFDYDGNKMASVPSSELGTGSNACGFAGGPQDADVGYLVSFQYGDETDNAKVLMLADDPNNILTYATTPSLYQNSNSQGLGDVDIKQNEDGTFTVFVLSTNNGFGAYKITFPFIVNGRFNEGYRFAAEKLNDNAGFGEQIDVKELFYGFDDENLYLAVDGELDVTNSNGIVLFLGLSNLSGEGASAGNSLGGIEGGGHLFGDADNPDFANDFETHYGFVVNPGGSEENVYLDAAKYSTEGNSAGYIVSTSQDGTSGEGPSEDGIFTANSVKFAFDNSHELARGLELCIPLSELGGLTFTDDIQLFAAVVSSTAYFSNATVPGNITGGNLEFNANFNALSGGPFHSDFLPLPVELSTFTATVENKNVKLKWVTVSEKNNNGFEVEKSLNDGDFQKIGFVSGKGTTTEKHTYSFADNDLNQGSYSYRLKQVDYDGSFSYSKVVNVEIENAPSKFELAQNYPNPFNPATTIKFSVPENGKTTLKVFNTLGEEVAKLLDKVAESGFVHEINFNASNLPSGVYFYTLRQGDNVSSKKMMLMK